MLTILHLITGLETGGAEGMLARLVAGSDRERFRHIVVSMTGPGSAGPTIAEAGVPLRSLGIRRNVPRPLGLLRLPRLRRRFCPPPLQALLYPAQLPGLARGARRRAC